MRRTDLEFVNRTESSDSEPDPIAETSDHKRWWNVTWYISLIFFSVDNKDTGLDVNACIHFWIKRCPELLWWFWFILQGSRIPSRPKNKAVRRKLHAWTATFRKKKKKGRYEFSNLCPCKTRPYEWALSTITVQALPLQLQFHRRTEKSRIKYWSLQWLGLPSVLTDMLHVRQRLRSPVPALGDPAVQPLAKMRLTTISDLKGSKAILHCLSDRWTKAVLENKRIN